MALVPRRDAQSSRALNRNACHFFERHRRADPEDLGEQPALELQIATDVTNAALTVRSSLESVQATAVARELAQKRHEAAQSKFEQGMATNYEVVQAQRDFSDARNNELRAILNYRKALVNFETVQTVGTRGVAAAGGGGGN